MDSKITKVRRKQGDEIEREQMQANLERDYGKCRPSPQEQKENLADLILKQRDELTDLRQKLDQERARVAELEGRPIEQFTPLSEEECDQYAKLPDTFNNIIRKAYEDGYTGYCVKANQFFGKHYRQQFEAALLRVRAEAVDEAATDLLDEWPESGREHAWLRIRAKSLHQTADEKDRSGGSQCQ